MPDQSEVTLPKVVMDRCLVIADYQRPYAWESKQLTDLWEDLDLMGTGHHYAGTLVLKKTQAPEVMSSDGEVLTTYEVVDGQQRLTTCLLLLDRIRRRFMELSETDVEGLSSAIDRLSRTYGTFFVEGVRRPRLQLGTDLNDYWLESVLGDHPLAAPDMVAGAQRLKAASDFFDSRIDDITRELDAGVVALRLRDLQRRVTDGLRFLVYEVHNDAEVGVIFETLNERGRPLTELEKVKNYLLYLARQLPEAQQEDLAAYINHEWSAIFKRLSRLPSRQEERLLRAHWLATFDPDSRKWERIQSVKRRFPRSKYVPGSVKLGAPSDTGAEESLWDELYHDVKEYVRTLGACATYLAEIYDSDAEYHDFSGDKTRIRRATAALLRSPAVALFLPLIFGTRLRHSQDGAGFADLIELCEKYSARVFAICARRATAGEPYLCRIAHDIYEGASVGEALNRIGALLWQYAPDEDVEANLRGSAQWYFRTAHKYFLYEYERHLARSDQDVIAWSQVNDTGARKTTEHILPQNPDPGSSWWDDFSPEQHEKLRHTLGNLMLTYDNSVYSNKEYPLKRGAAGQTGCYAASTLRQEQRVAQQFERWTPQSIDERQNEIADWAMTRWAVVRPSGPADEAPEVEAAIATEAEAPDSSPSEEA